MFTKKTCTTFRKMIFSKILRAPVLMAIGPAIYNKDFDLPNKKHYTPVDDDGESGWDRVKRMFQMDEFGRMSQELNSIYQAAFLGLFVGAVYGGFLGSRKSYVDFLERNEATAFKSHLDAKRKLQDQVTTGFAKNAFRFGWRLSLFTASLAGITTTIAVYRGKSSMYEYIIAGSVTGSMYKTNMGLRGMTAGALVGGVLGSVAGGVSLLILTTTGMTMEEARYYQYKWRQTRDDTMNEGLKTQARGTENYEPLYDSHDNKQGIGRSNLDINTLPIPDEVDAAQVKKEEIKVSR